MKSVIHLHLVVALAATVIVTACDTTTNTPSEATDSKSVSQRDVYHSLADCMADWGDSELCDKQQAEAKALAQQQAQNSGGHSTSFVPIFLGPMYSPGDRSAYMNGNRYSPATQGAASTATYLRNNRTGVVSAPSYVSPSKPTFGAPSVASRPSVSSSGVSRGGFGGGAVSSGG